ncbi:MAG: hypothetical protein ACI3WQ_09400 [Faecousia sp.]
MQSKTSCFNRAVFRKNLTRFAPVMALYTLLLMLMLLMAQNQSGTSVPEYYFLNQVDGVIQLMGPINLIYAALMAQLLFGDLYTSRMCNALHAMPLRRESWFVTNVASGLVYSLVPTAVATVILIPMLMKTIFVGAWKIAFWYFLAANLEFICLFGIAVFSAMLVGSRFTMVAGYGLINCGAEILYWLVDTVYTPMLYGMVTPSSLAYRLTPLYYMVQRFVKPEEIRKYTDDFGRLIPGVRGTYGMTEAWNALWVLAAVGIVFAVAALVLYRRRNLECAGDAVCSRKLIPVFQVLSALFVAVAAEFMLCEFFGRDMSYLTFVFLFAGLIVGWFAGKMLVERSARVFQLRNWIGLGILAVVLAVTLGLNKLDILNLEYRKPALEDIASVKISTNYSQDYTMEEQSDFETALKFHTLALEDRVEESGTYVLEDNGEYVLYYESNYRYRDDDAPWPETRNAARVRLTYTLKNGREVCRNYNVWVDSPAGQIVKELMSRWDAVNYQTLNWDGKDKTLPVVLGTFQKINCTTLVDECPDNLKNRAAAESLLRAIQADCEEGNMAQDPRFHKGVFVIPNGREPYETESIYLSLRGEEYSWSLEIYPECAHTLRWMRDNGMMSESVTIAEQGSYLRLY